MKNVFLSYARLDLKQARKLCGDLRKLTGVSVWFDKDDLLPGMRWRPAIRKSIREADYFIALMSKQSVAKKGFRHSELRQAFEIFEEFPDDKIFLIPTRLDDCNPPIEELRDITYADLFPNWADGVVQLGKSFGVKASKTAKRKITAKKIKKPAYHYKVSLVDLDDHRIKLQTLVRGLNKAQNFFHFAPGYIAPSQAALRIMDGEAQLDIDRLSNQFYSKIGPLEMDYVVGITHRYLMFDEDGFGDGEIRFIRLEYNGPDWDDGMDASEGADANFLAAFKRLSGLSSNQVARNGESHPISHLTKYPKGQAPPFVYMTGSRHIRLSAAERKTLREYIKGGGMIFADAGSSHWDREFRSQANSLLPGHRLTYIADDDPIFQIPFGFPNSLSICL